MYTKHTDTSLYSICSEWLWKSTFSDRLRLVILITSWKDRYHPIDDHRESGPGLTNFRNTTHCISSPAHFQKRENTQKETGGEKPSYFLSLHLCLTYFRFVSVRIMSKFVPTHVFFLFFLGASSWLLETRPSKHLYLAAGDAEVERVMQMVEWQMGRHFMVECWMNPLVHACEIHLSLVDSWNGDCRWAKGAKWVQRWFILWMLKGTYEYSCGFKAT